MQQDTIKDEHLRVNFGLKNSPKKATCQSAVVYEAGNKFFCKFEVTPRNDPKFYVVIMTFLYVKVTFSGLILHF